jgi:D-3-phosphoglycerate dehydrogenase
MPCISPRPAGSKVDRTRIDATRDYADFIEVRATGSGRSSRVAGALLAEGHPRVVRIGDFRLDVVPRGVLVLLRNRDVPGVIGRVGSLLGDAGINIAEYHQARLSAGGEAIAAISVDSPLKPEALAALRGLPEVLDARQVQFDPVGL